MSLKKWVRLSTACITLITLSACGGQDSNTEADSGNIAGAPGTSVGPPKLLEDGTLTVCTQASYKPFEFKEGAEIRGFDVDIVNEVAKDLQLTTKWVDMPFEGIKSGAALKSKKCDISVAAITINDKRKEVMAFSDPYFDASQALLARTDADISGLADLTGKRVGVQSGTTGMTFAQEHLPAAKLVEFESLPQITAAVQTGKLDAGIQDNGVLLNYAKENDDVSVVEEFGTDEQYGIAAASDNLGLVEAMNDTLERIETDGTMSEIEKRWFNSK